MKEFDRGPLELHYVPGNENKGLCLGCGEPIMADPTWTPLTPIFHSNYCEEEYGTKFDRELREKP